MITSTLVASMGQDNSSFKLAYTIIVYTTLHRICNTYVKLACIIIILCIIIEWDFGHTGNSKFSTVVGKIDPFGFRNVFQQHVHILLYM